MFGPEKISFEKSLEYLDKKIISPKILKSEISYAKIGYFCRFFDNNSGRCLFNSLTDRVEIPLLASRSSGGDICGAIAWSENMTSLSEEQSICDQYEKSADSTKYASELLPVGGLSV
jgi:hypothetical protein